MRGRTLAAEMRWIKKSSVEAVVVHAPRAPRRRAGPNPVDSVGLSNSSTRELALHAAALRPRARAAFLHLKRREQRGGGGANFGRGGEPHPIWCEVLSHHDWSMARASYRP